MTRKSQTGISRAKWRRAGLAVALLLCWTSAATGQERGGGEEGRLLMSRDSLQQLLTYYDWLAASSAYSPQLRGEAQRRAGLVRNRLAVGDFRPGDRILLYVEIEGIGQDTFTVTPARTLNLAGYPDVPLEGVLRSEVEQHIQEHLLRFVREPEVRARPLVRVAILGGVARPGFYTVAAQSLVSEAVMLAGGPLLLAPVDELRIERDEEEFVGDRPMREAIVEGRSLDELDVRNGDQIYVPTPRRPVAATLQTASIFLTLPLTLVVAAVQIF